MMLDGCDKSWLNSENGNGIDMAKEGFNLMAEKTGEMAEGWVEGWRGDGLRDGLRESRGMD